MTGTGRTSDGVFASDNARAVESARDVGVITMGERYVAEANGGSRGVGGFGGEPRHRPRG